MITRAVHELKCWPKYFAAIRAGEKNFEIRRNDRDFQVGDMLVLQEFDPETDAYTGQTETRMVRFLLSEEDRGVIHGFVAIGFAAAPTQDIALGGEVTTIEDLVAWHTRQADNAALRAEEARKVANAYRHPATGRPAMPVAADRHDAVSAAAAAEARFHAAAATIWERYV